MPERFWTVGDVVRKLREAKRRPNGKPWRQTDLATAAGVNKGTIIALEDESDKADQRTLYRVAQALEVSVGDLYALAEPVTMTTAQREAWNLWLSLEPHQQDSLMQTARLFEAQNHARAHAPHSATPGAPATAPAASAPKVRKA